jgi:hypothetical protein
MKNELLLMYSTPKMKLMHRLERLRVIYSRVNDRLSSVLMSRNTFRFMQLMNRLNRIQFAILEIEKKLN